MQASTHGFQLMNGEALQRTVILANPNGLHMRPCSAFAELAGRFECCHVSVSLDGKTADGKSVWDLLLLAAMPGSELVLTVVGPDAPRALEALANMLSSVPPSEN